MIDATILTQLQNVFSVLDATVELRFDHSQHAKQEELETMLSEVSTTSTYIKAIPSGTSSENPAVSLYTDNTFTGIRFEGIPGGHEFSSLILAILHANNKGKFPDKGIQQRIQHLKGPIHLRTVISLSCENCPDVVQTLNMMAVLNPAITHTMVDGAFIEDEIAELNIQGVPSVLHNKDLLSSGKTSLPELLDILETRFGTSTDAAPQDLGTYDSVIVGGGPAGVSAAIYLARKGLKTALICDRLGGQLQETKGIENFISVPYTEGPELSAQLRNHLSTYEVDIYEHRKVSTISADTLKTLRLTSGETLSSKTVIIATGAKWRELGIQGEKEYLGKGVAFCPHCDGPFYKGKDIAVIGGGNSGIEAALDLSGIVKSVTVLEYGSKLRADAVLVKKAQNTPNIAIITDAKTTSIIGDEKQVTELVYEDLTTQTEKHISLQGIFVQIGLQPNSQCVKDIVETTPYGEIKVDEKGRTSLPGVYAAGDVTTSPFKQIVIAMGDGAKVGLAVFEDLTIKSAV